MTDNEYQIVGLNTIHYIDKVVYDWNVSDEFAIKHTFLLIRLSDNTNFHLNLWTTKGMCSSGYTSASWAHFKLKSVPSLGSFHYRPISPLTLSIQSDNEYTLNCKCEYFKSKCDTQLLHFSLYGLNDDEYYPEGFYQINMDLFESTPRAKDNRQVWLFEGNYKNISYIAKNISELKVYDGPLQDVIYDDVIVHLSGVRVNDVVNLIYGPHDLHHVVIEDMSFDGEPPVWIFTGPSGTGKSYIASHLLNSNVYETDSSPQLDKTLIEGSNIIVHGNKYNYTLDDIRKLLSSYIVARFN